MQATVSTNQSSPTPVSASPTSGASKMDVKLVSPFINSVQTVFQMMASVSVKVLRPYLKSAGVAGTEYNVFGIIGFSGDLSGSVTASFTKDSASKLVEKFTGSACEPASPAFADAIGELANMIAGSAKSKLGLNAGITVPSVIIGDRCHIATLSDVPCVVIPCTCEIGDFAIEVSIKQNRAK